MNILFSVIPTIIGKKKTPVPIGNIYSKSAWTDLADFQTNTGFSLSGGKIQVASGAGYLRLPNPTKLDVWTLSVQYKLVSGTETSGGLRIGTQSSNTTVPASAYAIGNLDTTNSGKVTLYDSYSNSSYTSSTAITFAIGDTFQLDMAVNKGVITVTWKNITKNQTTSYTFTNTFTFGSTGVGPNTGRMAILGGSAVYEIESISYSSTANQGGICTEGDSITDGSNAESAANRWSERIGASMIGAGGGDKSEELLSRIPEIINIIKPYKVYIMIGTNDIFQSISPTIYKSNISSAVAQLQQVGIIVRLITTPPSNGADMSPIRNWEKATFPNITIDSWPTLSNGGTGLNPSFNSGDGTHWNAAGNLAVANLILGSGM